MDRVQWVPLEALLWREYDAGIRGSLQQNDSHLLLTQMTWTERRNGFLITIKNLIPFDH